MKVRLRINLGTDDARKAGIAPEECGEGSVVSVTDDAGEWLIEKRFAEKTSETMNAVPPNAPVQGIPPAPPSPADFNRVAPDNSTREVAESKAPGARGVKDAENEIKEAKKK